MSIEMIVTAAIAFIAGIGIGFFIGRSSMATAVEQSAEMEAELKKARQDRDHYRHQVKNHFEKTAELVGDLTNSYRDMTRCYKEVYEHLAQGAQTLANGDADMMIAASAIEKLIYEANEDAHVAKKPGRIQSKAVKKRPRLRNPDASEEKTVPVSGKVAERKETEKNIKKKSVKKSEEKHEEKLSNGKGGAGQTEKKQKLLNSTVSSEEKKKIPSPKNPEKR